MIEFDSRNYQLGDTLSLWWLGRPDSARLIGERSTSQESRSTCPWSSMQP